MDYEQLVTVMRRLSIEAGDKIMEIYGADDFEVKTKSDESPVTIADEAADKIISDGLRAAFPDVMLVTEEQARATLAPRPGMTAPVPPLRARPLATMRDMGMGDMGMDHGAMGHGMTAPGEPMRHSMRDMKSAGSSLKFCLIATGEADLYPRVGRTMEWDTAAGHAVLTGAGGAVVRFDDLTPLTYGKADFANPFFIAHAPGVDLKAS